MKKHIPEATRLLIVALLFGIRLSGAAQQPTTDSIATPDNELEGVSVIGYRKINTGNIHKQIFELEAKGVPKGASADRALRYVPGLLMGSAGYSILGSEQVAQVLIDGAPASPEELASLPAQSIWRIEILRGGVDGDRINIRRLRSLTREFKGRIDLGLSQPARYSASANLTLQTPTTVLTFIPSALWSRQEISSQLDRKSAGVAHGWHHQTTTKTKQASSLLRFDFFPSKHWDNTLVAMYSRNGHDGFSESTQDALPSQRLDETGYMQILQGHLASRYKWGESFLRLRGHLASEWDRQELSLQTATHEAENTYRSLTGDLTYQTKLEGRAGRHKLNTSYALTHRETRSSYSPQRYKSLIHALKLGDEVSWGEQWGGDFLLDMQYDEQRLSTLTRRAWYVLPYASLYYSGARDAVELSYDLSVSRPTGEIVDPTRYYTSDTEYTEGNASIANERTHTLALRYQRQVKQTFLSTAFTYTRTLDAIGRIHALADPQLETWTNVGRSTAYALSLGVNSSFFEHKMNLNLGTVLGYVTKEIAPEHRLTALSAGGSGLFYRGTLNLSYTTSRDWTYTIYAQWSGRELTFSYQRDHLPYVYFEVNKSFLDDRLSLTLSLLNPWGTMRTDTRYFFRDVTQTRWVTNNHSSGVRLGLTFSFGKRFRTRQGNETIEQTDRKGK